MPLFLGVHDFGKPLSDDDMKRNWEKYRISAKDHGAKAKRVYYNVVEGKSYCVTEAESAAVVDAAHAAVDLPTKELHEVTRLKIE